MDLNILSQPSIMGTTLTIIVLLQLVIIILLINVIAKITSSKDEIADTAAAPVIDKSIKSINDRLKNAERQQAKIRQGFDEDKNKKSEKNRPTNKKPKSSPDQKRNEKNTTNRRPQRPNNRNKNRNSVKSESSSPKVEKPQSIAASNENVSTPISTPVAKPALDPVVVSQKNSVAQENSVPQDKNETSHGRRPILQRRTLNKNETNESESDVSGTSKEKSVEV